MKLQHLLLTIIGLTLFNCKHDTWQLKQIKGEQITITDSLKSDPDIEAFIKPYREHVNNDLDSVLSYAVDTYSKSDGEFNTAIGNLFADVIYEQSNPVFFQRTGKNIDMVLLNHGGIRAIISKGPVSARTAFEIMPFENSIVVVGIKGSQINLMTEYLSKAKRAHPIAKLNLVLDADYSVKEATISGNPIDVNKTYYVATNDYLYNGGDHMTFFKPEESIEILDYKIRNAFIDYFKKTDTISPVIDNRFIKLKN
ncbi:5'-nucleotidase C-terminal domain-containing protein [Bizionia hallyeonensis]|uniref:5'-nucleotidase C-terminal domain-containing protein n=1 Tax=Bizionia hallyeonensis TaxID=1123757 RepID=A0ABW0C8G6_9FLAO